MITLDFEVWIGGNDVSNYVISIERNSSICEPTSTAMIKLSYEYAAGIIPYNIVVIYEFGAKVFTGFVANVTKGRLPPEYVLECHDPTIKLHDYWLEIEYQSSGETAEYWIGFFCTLAGVSYTFDTTYGRTIPDEYKWVYTSAFDVIRQLIVVGGYYMYSDPDGVIHFGKLPIGNLSNSLAITRFKREKSLEYARNKTIVFGKYPIAESATITVSELGTRIKTAIVATPYVETTGYAHSLATNMALHFGRIGDVKTADVEGDPDYKIGYRVQVTESWSGVNTLCLITSMTSTMGNDGYKANLVLDELCPYIWGYFVVVTITLYAGTDGHGVWKSDSLGLAWEDISGDLPPDALYVRGISASGAIVWAATMSGVFVTYSGGGHWSNKTPNLPAGCVLADWTDIEIDPANISGIYVLMDDLTNEAVYMYKTITGGATWTNVEIE